MVTPPESRPPAGRSSFALPTGAHALIRPTAAIYLSVAALIAALAVGGVLLQSLRRAVAAAQRGGQTSATLQQYSAAQEVWSELQAKRDPAAHRSQDEELRDSIRAALTVQFKEYRAELPAGKDQTLVNAVIDDLRTVETGLTDHARRAVIVLLARQTNALFQSVEAAQRAVHYTSVLLGLTLIGAGLLIVPLVRLYMRKSSA